MRTPGELEEAHLLKDSSGFTSPGGKKSTLVERVVANIRSEIVQGSLIAGERLVETALADRHKVARSTIREALHRLASMGFVVGGAHKGFAVRKFTHEDVVGLGEVFALLEIGALQSIRFPLPALTVAAMHRAAEQMAELDLPRDLVRFSELDRVFHGCLMAASERPWIEDAWRRQGQLLSVMAVPLLSPGSSYSGQLQCSRHLELLKSAIAGDRLALWDTIKAHYHQDKKADPGDC